jgi:hypothetical protein
MTLSERVAATHLHDQHNAAQLIERLAWAAIDAERLEALNDGEHADTHELAARPTRSRADRPSSRPTRALAGKHQGWA